MKSFLYILLFLFLSFPANSTHLLGGTITYKYLGGNSYALNLIIYHNGSLCEFPTPIQPAMMYAVELYDSSGTYFTSYILNRISIIPIQPYQGPCVIDSCYWLNKVLYSDTVNIPYIPGGYHLYLETCCRYNGIQSINQPTTVGEGFYTFIPDKNVYGNNNSPEWNIDPPLYFCLGYDVNYNCSAYDTDGDSLAYSFYHPFNDIDYTTPNDLSFSGGQPVFSLVPFISPYHSENVLNLNGTDSLRINSSGIIHGIPDNLGYFTGGIRCDEYRNGIKIGTIYRDMRLVVINCPPMPVADFVSVVDCASGNVQFTNTGTGDFYFWDFDTSLFSNDTSNLFSPSYNYSVDGCYDVLLTASDSSGCLSTTVNEVCAGITYAEFYVSDTVCTNTIISPINQSTFPTGSQINYSWTTSYGDTSLLPSPSFTFPSAGTVMIDLLVENANGCTDSVTHILYAENCLSVDEIDRPAEIILYPNPANEYIDINIFRIKYPNGKTTYNIFNPVGKLMKEGSIEKNETRILLPGFPDGNYIITVEEEGRLFGKIIFTVINNR
ncbi:MAG: T9SS type A sorting domain-containing protein [Bacteroidota bacterium]